MRKTSSVSVTDLFCGAGGSSLGASALGADITWALNHWDRAIETHAHNFPNTRHERTDIRAADPRRYDSTDVLFASPECVNHSLAKGVARRHQQTDLWGDGPDPSAERSRATMWDVPRFAEAHDYNIIIVENVVEARKWVLWDSWIHAMTVSLNYDFQIVYLNSMFAWPTPQSRDRMYIVFHKRGNTRPDLDIRPLAHCVACGKNVNAVQCWKSKSGARWGRYKQQYVYCCPTCAAVVEPFYYAAANAIDWKLPIERVGERKQPLKPKTMARIEEGLRRFAGRPFLGATSAALFDGNLHQMFGDVWPTQTSAKGMFGVVPPFTFSQGAWDNVYRGLSDALPGVTTSRGLNLVMPFLTALDQSRLGTNIRSVDDVLPTMTTATTTGMCIPPSPFLIEVGHGGPENAGRLKHICAALPTTHTMGGVGVVVPLSHAGGEDRAHSIDEAFPTQTARQDLALALAPFIAELHGTSSVRSVEEAIACVVAGGNHHGLVHPPFTVTYNGTDGGAHSLSDALGTQPTHDRHALVEPGRLPSAEECGFRVLKPHEIQAAMAFPREYVVTGTNREKVKQLGNAVTPPVMSLLWERCLATLASERIA